MSPSLSPSRPTLERRKTLAPRLRIIPALIFLPRPGSIAIQIRCVLDSMRPPNVIRWKGRRSLPPQKVPYSLTTLLRRRSVRLRLPFKVARSLHMSIAIRLAFPEIPLAKQATTVQQPRTKSSLLHHCQPSLSAKFAEITCNIDELAAKERTIAATTNKHLWGNAAVLATVCSAFCSLLAFITQQQDHPSLPGLRVDLLGLGLSICGLQQIHLRHWPRTAQRKNRPSTSLK